jgi:putative transposase
MAPKWSNDNLAGALHFVTGNVLNREPIFHSEQAYLEFLKTLQDLKVKRESKLIAFVIMPDHFHLVVNPRDGKISEWTGALKSLTARDLIRIMPTRFLKTSDDDREHQVWQESFKSLPLWSNWMIWQKINYIHANPVRARLADSARDYRWTSFRAFYFDESEALFQIDKDWWWPDDVQKLERSMAELNEEK